MTRLQQLRIDAGLTVQQLADKADVPASAVYRLESGKGTRMDRLTALAKVLKVRPSELLLASVAPAETTGEAA